MQVKGCCPLDCQDSCAWVAHVEDGQVTRVEGAKDHPVTRGVLCAKVKDYEGAAHRARPPAPAPAADRPQGQRAVRAHLLGRGAGRDRQPLPRHHRGAWGGGADALFLSRQPGRGAAPGAEPHLPCAGRQPPDGRRLRRVGGRADGRGPPDRRRSGGDAGGELIILWGQNVLSTCHHQWHFIEAARKRGARVIAIDPCRPAPRSNATCISRPGPARTRCWPPPSAAICWTPAGRTSNLAELWVERPRGLPRCASHPGPSRRRRRQRG